MSFLTSFQKDQRESITPSKKGKHSSLFQSSVDKPGSCDSEDDAEPRHVRKSQRSPPIGLGDHYNAKRSGIFAGTARKRGRLPSNDSSDDPTVSAKKPSILDFRPSKQTGPKSISSGSDYDAEMIEESGGEERAETAKSKPRSGVGRSKKVPTAVSSTPRESTRAPLDLPGNTINSRLIMMRQAKVEALEEQEERKVEVKAALELKKKDLQRRQTDVDERQEVLNKIEEVMSNIKGQISGIDLALGV